MAVLFQEEFKTNKEQIKQKLEVSPLLHACAFMQKCTLDSEYQLYVGTDCVEAAVHS